MYFHHPSVGVVRVLDSRRLDPSTILITVPEPEVGNMVDALHLCRAEPVQGEARLGEEALAGAWIQAVLWPCGEDDLPCFAVCHKEAVQALLAHDVGPSR